MVSQIVEIELIDLPLLMQEFEVDKMSIVFDKRWGFKGRHMHRPLLDLLTADASFVLPAGANYDLSSDNVFINVDGVVIDIPAGSFKAVGNPKRQLFRYNSPRGAAPDIEMSLDFRKGTMDLRVNDIDLSAVDSYDGVDVMLGIGSIVGMENIDMHIDSLSYKGQ
jgi:hypothetical protein